MTGREKSQKLTPERLDQLARLSRMVERHLKRVGRAIEIRRLDLGLSRPQLARLIPVADKTVERWEKGQTSGADAQLDRVAEVMGTTSQAMLAAALAEEESEERQNGTTPDVLGQLKPSTATDDEATVLLHEVRDMQSVLASKLDTLLAEQERLRKLLPQDAPSKASSRKR